MEVYAKRKSKSASSSKLDIFLRRFVRWVEAQKPLMKNKFSALTLLAVGALSVLIDGDATALILLFLFAIPLFFAKENWIM